jgi:hypothetical protein
MRTYTLLDKETNNANMGTFNGNAYGLLALFRQISDFLKDDINEEQDIHEALEYFEVKDNESNSYWFKYNEELERLIMYNIDTREEIDFFVCDKNGVEK